MVVGAVSLKFAVVEMIIRTLLFEKICGTVHCQRRIVIRGLITFNHDPSNY